jgi:hypothetical protein
MKRQLLKNSSVLFVVIIFSLVAGVALAEKKHWFVVKDKDGICKVIEVETVPLPLKTIAGPLKTMKEAEMIKAKECPKGTGPASQQLRPEKEQPEQIRRQHQEREESQKQQDLKQQQTPRQQQMQSPQQEQQSEKLKGKTQESNEGAKSSGEKVQEKTKEPIPSD